MGYCKNCGAYIPDGHTKCLACGLDQTEYEESAAASAAAKKSTARRQDNDELEMLSQEMQQFEKGHSL